MYEYQNPHKLYVRVGAVFELGGRITPKWIQHADSARVPIDRIMDERPAASLKAGGAGIRYTIRIREREFYLFHDDFRNDWYIEH